MSLKNIEQVRDWMLQAIEKADSNKLNLDKLFAITKTCEGVFSSVKLQLSYNHMRGEEPNIKFLEDCNKGIPLKEEPKRIK